jgi:hypothetical protein
MNEHQKKEKPAGMGGLLFITVGTVGTVETALPTGRKLERRASGAGLHVRAGYQR